MHYPTLPHSASMREVQRNYKRLFAQVKKTKTPLYLLSQSTPEMVVLDVEMYEHLVNSLQKSEELRLKSVIATGDAEYAAKKTKTGKLSQLL